MRTTQLWLEDRVSRAAGACFIEGGSGSPSNKGVLRVKDPREQSSKKEELHGKGPEGDSYKPRLRKTKEIGEAGIERKRRRRGWDPGTGLRRPIGLGQGWSLLSMRWKPCRTLNRGMTG